MTAKAAKAAIWYPSSVSVSSTFGAGVGADGSGAGGGCGPGAGGDSSADGEWRPHRATPITTRASSRSRSMRDQKPKSVGWPRISTSHRA
eukprot:5411194-Prymnesium_polylepis.1